MPSRYSILAVVSLCVLARPVHAESLHDQVIRQLRGKTPLPLAFPSWLPNPSVHGLVSADGHSYFVELTSDANATRPVAMAGHLGSFAVYDKAGLQHQYETERHEAESEMSQHPDWHIKLDGLHDFRKYFHHNFEAGTRVSIGSGVVGFYVGASPESRDGGSSFLHWTAKGLYYTLELRRLVSAQDMVRSALSTQ